MRLVSQTLRDFHLSIISSSGPRILLSNFCHPLHRSMSPGTVGSGHSALTRFASPVYVFLRFVLNNLFFFALVRTRHVGVSFISKPSGVF